MANYQHTAPRGLTCAAGSVVPGQVLLLRLMQGSAKCKKVKSSGPPRAGETLIVDSDFSARQRSVLRVVGVRDRQPVLSVLWGSTQLLKAPANRVAAEVHVQLDGLQYLGPLVLTGKTGSLTRVTHLGSAAAAEALGIPRCSKVQERPVVTLPDGLLDWLQIGERGEACRTLASALSNIPLAKGSFHPMDVGDFSRCVQLLDFVPEWRARLPEAARLSPTWRRLIGRWKKLEETYREEAALGLGCPKTTQALRAATSSPKRLLS